MSFFMKIKEVFTKEYKEETKKIEVMKENIDSIKFKSEKEDWLKGIKKLQDTGFQSNFHINNNSQTIVNEKVK